MKKFAALLSLLALLVVGLFTASPASADTSTLLGNGCFAGGWEYRADAQLIKHSDITFDWGYTDVYHSHQGTLYYYLVNGNTGSVVALLFDPNWVGSRHYTWPQTNSHYWVADNMYLKAHFVSSNGHTCNIWFNMSGDTSIQNG